MSNHDKASFRITFSNRNCVTNNSPSLWYIMKMTIVSRKVLPIPRTGWSSVNSCKALRGWVGILCRPFWSKLFWRRLLWPTLGRPVQCLQTVWLVAGISLKIAKYHTQTWISAAPEDCDDWALWVSNSMDFPSKSPHPPHHAVQPATLIGACGFVIMTSRWFEFFSLGSQTLILLQLASVSKFYSAGFSHWLLGYSSQRRKKTLGQRLLGILPSENSSKRTEDQDNQHEVFKMLIDLVSTGPPLAFC